MLKLPCLPSLSSATTMDGSALGWTETDRPMMTPQLVTGAYQHKRTILWRLAFGSAQSIALRCRYRSSIESRAGLTCRRRSLDRFARNRQQRVKRTRTHLCLTLCLPPPLPRALAQPWPSIDQSHGFEPPHPTGAADSGVDAPGGHRSSFDSFVVDRPDPIIHLPAASKHTAAVA